MFYWSKRKPLWIGVLLVVTIALASCAIIASTINEVQSEAHMQDALLGIFYYSMRYDSIFPGLDPLGIATTELASAIEVNPNNLEAKMLLGLVQQNQGQYHEALQIYQDMIALSGPDNAWMHVLIGNVELKLERWEQARSSYSLALDTAELAGAYMGLGYLAAREADSVLAREHYQQAVELSPNSVFARVSLAILDLEFADNESALNHLQVARSLNVNNAKVHFYLGIAYTQLGQLEEAAFSFERATALNPTLKPPE